MNLPLASSKSKQSETTSSVVYKVGEPVPLYSLRFLITALINALVLASAVASAPASTSTLTVYK